MKAIFYCTNAAFCSKISINFIFFIQLVKNPCYSSPKYHLEKQRKKTERELANPGSSGKWLIKWKEEVE